MSAKTTIEWATRSWNPVRGCSRVSPGCDECYAMKFAHRFSGAGKPYEGLTTIRKGKVDWSGVARFIPSELDAPLRWRKPERIFVNSMSDLFHPSLDLLTEVRPIFETMLRARHHQFLVLTKRPERMREFTLRLRRGTVIGHPKGPTLALHGWQNGGPLPGSGDPFVLPNVWLGVSVENQETADERIPLLLACPAAVRWISAEPLLGPVNLAPYLRPTLPGGARVPVGLDWVVVGGESGPGARPFDAAWARSIVAQCKGAGSACFVKQLGGNLFAPWKVRWDERHDGSFDAFSSDGVGTRGTNFATVWPNAVWHTWDANGTGGENDSDPTVGLAKQAAIEALQRQHVHPVKGWARHTHMLRSRKGADPSEWPEDLRVRDFPTVRA